MKRLLLLLGLITISFAIAFDTEMHKADLTRFESQKRVKSMRHVAPEMKISDEMLTLQKARTKENTLSDPGKRYRRPGQEIYGEVYTHAAPQDQLAAYADKPEQLQYYLAKGGRTGSSISSMEKERRKLPNVLKIDEGLVVTDSIINAGSEDVSVYSFSLSNAALDILIPELHFLIEGGMSNGDRNDFESLSSLSLWYEDGSPVQTIQGRDAVSSRIAQEEGMSNSGLISFNSLDLTVGHNPVNLLVKASFETVGDDAQDTALDASLIRVSLYNPESIKTDAQRVQNNYVQDTAHRLLATQPLITLHKDTPDDVVSGDDVTLQYITLSNPDNAADSSIYTKALAVRIRTIDEANDDLVVENLNWRDANNPSTSISECRRFDDVLSGTMTNEEDLTFVCNFENTASGTITQSDSGFEIAEDDSETLFLTADISNYSLAGDAIQIELLTNASARSEVNIGNLHDGAADFANLDSETPTGFVWLARESNEVSAQLSQGSVSNCLETIEKHCPITDDQYYVLNTVVLGDDTVTAATDDVVVFHAYLQNFGSEAFHFDSFLFDVDIPDGHSDELENFSFYASHDSGNTWILMEDGESIHPVHKVVDFDSLTPTNLIVGPGLEVEIMVTVDISEAAGEEQFNFNLALADENISVSVADPDLTIERSSFTYYGPSITVSDTGSLAINAGSTVIDSSHVIAGTDNFSFSTFDLTASEEAFLINDIDVSIWGGFEDTQGSTGFRALDSVSLWYNDGSPVKFTNNSNALLTGISLLNGETNSGVVSFTDLNLLIPEGQTETIHIKGSVATVGDDSADIAASGSQIRVGLSEKAAISATGQSSGFLLSNNDDFDGTYDFLIDTVLMSVVGTAPILTLHAQSPDTVAAGSDIEVFRFTVSNPTNTSNSDVILKALAITTDIVDGSGNDLTIESFALRDASNPSGTVSQCHRSDDDSQDALTDIDNSTMICNFQTNFSNSVSESTGGFEISNGTSETLFLTVDVSGFNLEEDSLLFSLEGFGSLTGTVNFSDLSDVAADFGQNSENQTSIVWYDEEGDTLLYYFDSALESFRSNRLTGF